MYLKARKLNAKSILVGRVFEVKENPRVLHQDVALIITPWEQKSERVTLSWSRLWTVTACYSISSES